jgi:phytanoyl-CoA hydroxylase
MVQFANVDIDPAVSGQIVELDAQPTPDQVTAFRLSGVGVVRGLLSVEETQTIRDAYMAAAADGPIDGLSETGKDQAQGDSVDPLKRYPRMLHPHRFADLEAGRLALQYMLDARISRVLRAVTGEEPIAAQSMFYFKPPGARGQGLHQDNNPLAVKPGTCMAAWIPVDRCDADNGALSVVPGTGPLEMLCDAESESRADLFFNGGTLKLPEGIEPVTADMELGDVLFFNGQTIHGSYPNTTTDRWRRTLIFHYAPESCEEIADFYHPLLDMQGQVVERGRSRMGGLCGEYREAPKDGAMGSMGGGMMGGAMA